MIKIIKFEKYKIVRKFFWTKDMVTRPFAKI